jgi:hypothetical protein
MYIVCRSGDGVSLERVRRNATRFLIIRHPTLYLALKVVPGLKKRLRKAPPQHGALARRIRETLLRRERGAL